jgi:cell fate (sporulation/competence/biofilm development) regulator YlbF (YheA/YmcA/DUF963 family)
MEVIYETKKDNFKLTDEQIAEKRRIEAVKIAEEKTEKKIKEWSKETGEEDLVRDYFRAQKKLKIIFSQTRNNNRYDS